MPDYQNEYGGGFDQSYGVYYSNWGPSFRKEGVDGWGNDPAGVIDENGTVPHPYGNDPVNGSSFLANFLDGNNVYSKHMEMQDTNGDLTRVLKTSLDPVVSLIRT